MESLALASIAVDARCQPRVTMNPELVEDYAAAMQSGERFPPLTVFNDGVTHWLADGFHRYAAALQIGANEIDADVYDGDVRDAILYSVGANAAHGLRRTNSDKQRAIETLLKDEEWSAHPNTWIAGRCGVSEGAVRNARERLSSQLTKIDQRIVQRGDSTYTMDVSSIGKAPAIPQVHGSLPPDIMGDLFGDVEDAEPEQAPLPAAISWEESDRKAADSAVRCLEFVGNYDAQRVAYAVAANGPEYRSTVMDQAIELRRWMGELVHQLSKLK